MATRQEWEDRIRAHLGDHGVIQHVSPTKIPFALETALAILSGDRPYEADATLAGDSSTYDLTLTSWEDRWSRVLQVEYPTGQRTPIFLEDRRYTVLRGTTTFRLLEDIPITGESAKVTYSIRWPMPDDTSGTDKIPTPWFEAVTSLAASRLVKSTAVEWARQTSAHVAGLTVDRDPQPLFSAAAMLKGMYDEVVLGIPESAAGTAAEARSEIAYAQDDVDVFPDAIFRRRPIG